MPTNNKPPTNSKLSGLEANSLQDLLRHPGFKLLLEYLRDRQAVHSRQCLLLDPQANATEIARRQGAYGALQEFHEPTNLIGRIADFAGRD